MGKGEGRVILARGRTGSSWPSPTRYLTLPAVMPSTMCRLKTM